MKRLIICITMLCLLATMSLHALADEHTMAAVHYGADIGYTVYIPEVVSVGETGRHYAEIRISDALLPSNTLLAIMLSGNSYKDGNWHLHSTENTTIAYRIVVENAEGKFTVAEQNTEIIRCHAGEASLDDMVRSLCFDLTESPKEGVFSDLLTFVITYHQN